MLDIKITRTETPKEKPAKGQKLGFGKIFTDHMFVMNYTEGQGWHDPRVVPFQNISLSPAAMVYHYGQEMFEGLKAYKGDDGEVYLFRPDMNAKRTNASNDRLVIPQLPEEDFVQAVKAVVDVDRDWVPTEPGTSLYIRPFIIATDEFLGVAPSKTYLFIIFFKINGTVITPMLNGSILPGITRNSVLELCRSWGYPTEERKISADELIEAQRNGTLEECWGTGTAAVISPVGKLRYVDEVMTINGGQIGELSQKLYDTITGIQTGKLEDPRGWRVTV